MRQQLKILKESMDPLRISIEFGGPGPGGRNIVGRRGHGGRLHCIKGMAIKQNGRRGHGGRLHCIKGMAINFMIMAGAAACSRRSSAATTASKPIWQCSSERQDHFGRARCNRRRQRLLFAGWFRRQSKEQFRVMSPFSSFTTQRQWERTHAALRAQGGTEPAAARAWSTTGYTMTTRAPRLAKHYIGLAAPRCPNVNIITFWES